MHTATAAPQLKAMRKRRQTINLGLLALAVLFVVLYMTWLLSRVPYGSTVGSKASGGAKGGGEPAPTPFLWKLNKVDIAELEEGGEVAISINKPPKTQRPLTIPTASPPRADREREEQTPDPIEVQQQRDERAEDQKPAEFVGKKHRSTPANQEPTEAQPVDVAVRPHPRRGEVQDAAAKAEIGSPSTHAPVEARETAVPPTRDPRDAIADDVPPEEDLSVNRRRERLAGHDDGGVSQDGSEPSSDESSASGDGRVAHFSNIHTKPLASNKQRKLELPSVFPLSDENVIGMGYSSIAENQRDNRFFEADRAFWDEYPALVSLLKKFQTLNLEMAQGKRAKRYVTVTPVGQLCNRLVAISSAFFFALVTRRGLLIDDTGFYAESTDLFEEPGFPWISKSGGAFQGSVANDIIQNPESGVWDETEKLLCGTYSDVYGAAHIHFSVNQYLVPYMTNNPKYRDSIREVFRGDDVFHPLQKFLFRPIEELRRMRDDFVQTHFKGHFVVGLQVRSGPDFTSNFVSAHDWSIYKNCALAATPGPRRSGLKYFVATDTEDGRKAAIRELGKDNVMFGPGPFLLSNHPRGVQMALLDIMLLAAADDRVTTAWSSYGYFSAGMSGFPANMVVDNPGVPLVAPKGKEQRFMGVPHKSDKREQCVRLPTLQPCFHKFESWGASTATCFKKEMFEREMLNGRYC